MEPKTRSSTEKFFLTRTIDTTPAVYGMIWATPTLLVDGLAATVKLLPSGALSELFPLLIEDQDIPVMFNFEVNVKLFLFNFISCN